MFAASRRATGPPDSLGIIHVTKCEKAYPVVVQSNWIAEVSELRALAAIAERQAGLTLDRVAAKAFEQMASGYRREAEKLEDTVLASSH